MLDLFGAIGIMRAFTSKYEKLPFDSLDVKGETWEMNAKDFDQRFDKKIGIGNCIVDQINFQISCFDNLKTEIAKKYAKPLVNFYEKLFKTIRI